MSIDGRMAFPLGPPATNIGDKTKSLSANEKGSRSEELKSFEGNLKQKDFKSVLQESGNRAEATQKQSLREAGKGISKEVRNDSLKERPEPAAKSGSAEKNAQKSKDADENADPKEKVGADDRSQVRKKTVSKNNSRAKIGQAEEGQEEKSEVKNKQVSQFMDSLESELGIPSARFAEALENLSDTDRQKPVAENIPAIVSNLAETQGLSLPDQQKAEAMLWDLNKAVAPNAAKVSTDMFATDLNPVDQNQEAWTANALLVQAGLGAQLGSQTNPMTSATPASANLQQTAVTPMALQNSLMQSRLQTTDKKAMLENSRDVMNQKVFMSNPNNLMGPQARLEAQAQIINESAPQMWNQDISNKAALLDVSRLQTPALADVRSPMNLTPATGPDLSALQVGMMDPNTDASGLGDLNGIPANVAIDPSAAQVDAYQTSGYQDSDKLKSALMALGLAANGMQMAARASTKLSLPEDGLNANSMSVDEMSPHSFLAMNQEKAVGAKNLADQNPSQDFSSDKGASQNPADLKGLNPQLSQMMRDPSSFANHLAAAGIGLKGMQSEMSAGDQAMNTSQILKQAQLLISKGGGEARVEMTPEGMGTIQLQLRMEDGRVNMSLMADRPETKKYLEQSLGDLKSQLNDHKLQVESMKVHLASAVDTRQDSSSLMKDNASQNPNGQQPDQGQKSMDMNQFQQRQQAWNFMNNFKDENRAKFGDADLSPARNYGRAISKPDSLTEAAGAERRYQSQGKGAGLDLVA